MIKNIKDYFEDMLNESKESRELMKKQNLTYTGYGVYKDMQGNKFEYDPRGKRMIRLSDQMVKEKLGDKLVRKIRFDATKTGRSDYDELLKNKDLKKTIIKMSPEFFLRKTSSYRYKLDRTKVEKFKNEFRDKNITIPSPTMVFDKGKKFKNVGDLSDFHDGMHRVVALKELGIKRMLVIVIEEKVK